MFTSVRDAYRLLFYVAVPFSKQRLQFQMRKSSSKVPYECIKQKTTSIRKLWDFLCVRGHLRIICLLATFSEFGFLVYSVWIQKSVILVHFSHLFVLGKLSELLICARGTWCVFWEVCLTMCSLACYLHKLTRLLGALAGWMSPWF